MNNEDIPSPRPPSEQPRRERASSFDGEVRDPIDRVAAKLLSKGQKVATPSTNTLHWEVRPPVRATGFKENLRGQKFGKMTVIGLSEIVGSGKTLTEKERWVVRCDCGCFEVRTVKAILNPKNRNDACLRCRKTEQSKRKWERWNRKTNK